MILGGAFSAKAAERFELHFEDMSIPVSIEELNDWTKGNSESNDSELAGWLNLLGLESRNGLVKFFQTPFIKDKEVALQLLRSWFGRKMLNEVSDLVRLDEDTSGATVATTLESLLNKKNDVTLLDLVSSLPAEVIHLDLDGMVKVANSWRKELKRQQKLLSNLADLSVKPSTQVQQKYLSEKLEESIYEVLSLPVKHRKEPLKIDIWNPSERDEEKTSWIVFMPGLGGDKSHFHWLARSLSHHGWPVIILDHPGSDSDSLQALLDGRLPAPGLDVIPKRLSDLQSVLDAREEGTLNVTGSNLILMGHSLGSLTAFIASGAQPLPGLEKRCKKAFDDLSLTNLSEILQCQFVDFTLPKQAKINDLKAIVAINSFGSLLWPKTSSMQINVPVLFTGGTFDLITPAITEQLGLFLAVRNNPLSRILLIEGASHFSPIRVKGQLNQSTGKDVFQIGDSLVGFHPLSVQSLLAIQIINFISNLENEKPIPSTFNHLQDDLKFHILDSSSVKKLLQD
tara:strand:- start:996 stop:2531 length:1536 start_codon:yes stop_codon:yes gene_type:complete